MITIHSSSTYSSDPANANPVTYQGPVVTPPNGAAVWVFATCDAPPDTPTSTIVITGATGGHTPGEVITIDQGEFGANPPITVWAFPANGSALQVTQQGLNGASGGQKQAVVVVEGASVVGTISFRGMGQPNMSDPGPAPAGSLALFGFADSPNTVDTMTAAFGSTLDFSEVPDVNTIPGCFGHKFVSGSWQVGIAALANQGGTNGICIVLESIDPVPTHAKGAEFLAFF